MNPDAGGIIIPEYNAGGIILPAMDGIVGPVTRQALDMSRLANIVKTMQTNAAGMDDSFRRLSDGFMNGFMKLAKDVSEVVVALGKDVPPTTAEVRMQRLNLARTVKDRG